MAKSDPVAPVLHAVAAFLAHIHLRVAARAIAVTAGGDSPPIPLYALHATLLI